MQNLNITTMTARGQVVIPQSVRKSLSLKVGSKFIVLNQDDTIIFKSVTPPTSQQLKQLLLNTRKAVKKSKLSKSDLKKTIADARKSK